jgi:hypothetical protein
LHLDEAVLIASLATAAMATVVVEARQVQEEVFPDYSDGKRNEKNVGCLALFHLHSCSYCFCDCH